MIGTNVTMGVFNLPSPFSLEARALLLAAMLVLVRCDETLVNDQFTFDDSNASSVNNHIMRDLKSGDTISITLDVSHGTIIFKIEDTRLNTLLDKEGIGTAGWQGQWTVPNDGTYNFALYLARDISSAAAGTITVTSAAGSGGQQPAQQGGGFDPTPIVAAVVVLLVWFIFVLLIVRMRKQPPPPAEGQPPPP